MIYSKTIKSLFSPLFILSLVASFSFAQKWITLPYAFSTERTNTTLGLVTLKKGLLQDQSTFVATAFKSKSLWGAGFLFSDLVLPQNEKFSFSTWGMKRYLANNHYFNNTSHHSSQYNQSISSGEYRFFSSMLSYSDTLGKTKDISSLGLKSFYLLNTFDNRQSLNKWQSNGLRVFFSHEATDLAKNPSRGYQINLQYSKDFAMLSSLQAWDFLEFKYNRYYSLPPFSFTQSNVLAFSLWTGYSFSWDKNTQISPNIDKGRTPLGEGGTLGGMTRMRAYATERFSDKAVLYGSVELRSTLKYNPLKDASWLPIEVQWFQLVGFVEWGRVHHQYTPTLLNDMKFDVGLSLRTMLDKVPVRFDLAYGDEGINIWLMLYHPFDF